MIDVRTQAARSTDPATSHEAADFITRDGSRARQQNRAVEIVRSKPGHTSNELADLCGLDRYMLARRLPECESAGAVHKGAPRVCKISGRKAVTWHPGMAPAELAA